MRLTRILATFLSFCLVSQTVLPSLAQGQETIDRGSPIADRDDTELLDYYPPSDLASVTDSYLVVNSSAPLVILIQDLHTHPGVQRKISKLLEHYSSHGIAHDFVAIEGVQGALDTGPMALFPDEKIKLQVTDEFVDKGLFTGMDDFAIRNKKASYLWGVDDEEVYELHKAFFRKSYEARTRLASHVRDFKARLKALEPEVLNFTQRKLKSKQESYRSGKLSLKKYLDCLEEKAGEVPPELAQMQSLLKMEVHLPDSEELKDHTKAFLTLLHPRLTPEETDKLAQYAKSNPEVYYLYLFQLANRHNALPGASTALRDYLLYCHKKHQQNLALFQRKLEDLEQQLLLSQSKTKIQKNLIQAQRDLDQIQSLLECKLTEDQLKDLIPKTQTLFSLLETLLSPSSGEDNLKELITQALDFYSLALMRDKPMVDQTLSKMNEKSSQAAVVVTGGFHTAGMARLLKEKQVSYLVLSPQVDSYTDQDQKRYLELVLGKLPKEYQTTAPSQDTLTPFGRAEHTEIFSEALNLARHASLQKVPATPMKQPNKMSKSNPRPSALITQASLLVGLGVLGVGLLMSLTGVEFPGGWKGVFVGESGDGAVLGMVAASLGNVKLFKRDVGVTADEFEAGIVRAFEIRDGSILRGKVKVAGKIYPYTMSHLDLGFKEPFYFRAGDIFVLNADGPHWLHILKKGKKDRELNSLLRRYSKVILLTEYKPREHVKGGWIPYTLGAGIYYHLPQTIGSLIALQALQEQIKGQTFIDIGSRNALKAIAALKLGARDAILVENEMIDVPIIGLNRIKYRLPEPDNLIHINLLMNGVLDRARIYPQSVSDFEPMALNDAVLDYNFVDFGYDYYDTPESVVAETALRSKYEVKARKKMTELRRQTNESLLKVIHSKFKGLQYIIASGGNEGRDEERLIDEARSLGFERQSDIRIPQSVAAEWLDATIPASTMHHPTLVFKAKNSSMEPSKRSNVVKLIKRAVLALSMGLFIVTAFQFVAGASGGATVSGIEKEFLSMAVVGSENTVPSGETKPRILVVDDDDEVLVKIRTILGDDFIVDTAGSGEEGFRKGQSQDYDLVLTDTSMEVSHAGAELIERLRGIKPDGSYILMSSEPLSIIIAERVGVAFVRKAEASLNKLPEKIEKEIAKSKAKNVGESSENQTGFGGAVSLLTILAWTAGLLGLSMALPTLAGAFESDRSVLQSAMGIWLFGRTLLSPGHQEGEGGSLLAPPITDEAKIREILKTNPFHTLTRPDGTVFGVQSRVLVSEAVPFVVKVDRTKEESRAIIGGWKWGAVTEPLEDWLERMQLGKENGRRIEREKLSRSQGIYQSLVLKDVEIRESVRAGETRLQRHAEVCIQRKANTLYSVIKELYAGGKIETLKSVLNQVLKVTEEEIWAYGVFDLAGGYQVNWGVEWDEQGQPVVGLFDFGELVDEYDQIKPNRLTAEYWKNHWVIFDPNNPFSIYSLTNREIAEWFYGRVLTTFTQDNLQIHWQWKVQGAQGETKPRILVVNDNEMWPKKAAEILGEGYVVEWARDGEEALRMVRERSYDLVLTDLSMRRISGIQLIKSLSQSHPNLPCILMSANASTHRVASFVLGRIPFAFLSKFNLNQLPELTKEEIAKSKARSAEASSGNQSDSGGAVNIPAILAWTGLLAGLLGLGGTENVSEMAGVFAPLQQMLVALRNMGDKGRPEGTLNNIRRWLDPIPLLPGPPEPGQEARLLLTLGEVRRGRILPSQAEEAIVDDILRFSFINEQQLQRIKDTLTAVRARQMTPEGAKESLRDVVVPPGYLDQWINAVKPAPTEQAEPPRKPLPMLVLFQRAGKTHGTGYKQLREELEKEGYEVGRIKRYFDFLVENKVLSMAGTWEFGDPTFGIATEAMSKTSKLEDLLRRVPDRLNDGDLAWWASLISGLLASTTPAAKPVSGGKVRVVSSEPLVPAYYVGVFVSLDRKGPSDYSQMTDGEQQAVRFFKETGIVTIEGDNVEFTPGAQSRWRMLYSLFNTGIGGPFTVREAKQLIAHILPLATRRPAVVQQALSDPLHEKARQEVAAEFLGPNTSVRSGQASTGSSVEKFAEFKKRAGENVAISVPLEKEDDLSGVDEDTLKDYYAWGLEHNKDPFKGNRMRASMCLTHRFFKGNALSLSILQQNLGRLQHRIGRLADQDQKIQSIIMTINSALTPLLTSAEYQAFEKGYSLCDLEQVLLGTRKMLSHIVAKELPALRALLNDDWLQAVAKTESHQSDYGIESFAVTFQRYLEYAEIGHRNFLKQLECLDKPTGNADDLVDPEEGTASGSGQAWHLDSDEKFSLFTERARSRIRVTNPLEEADDLSGFLSGEEFDRYYEWAERNYRDSFRGNRLRALMCLSHRFYRTEAHALPILSMGLKELRKEVGVDEGLEVQNIIDYIDGLSNAFNLSFGYKAFRSHYSGSYLEADLGNTQTTVSTMVREILPQLRAWLEKESFRSLAREHVHQTATDPETYDEFWQRCLKEAENGSTTLLDQFNHLDGSKPSSPAWTSGAGLIAALGILARVALSSGLVVVLLEAIPSLGVALHEGLGVEGLLGMAATVGKTDGEFEGAFDQRPVEAGLLHELFVRQDMAVKSVVNPQDEDKVAIYGGAGADVSNFLLSLNATRGYFVARYFGLSAGDLRSFFARGQDERSFGWIDRFCIDGYRDFKFDRGCAFASKIASRKSGVRALWVELRALGVDVSKIKVSEELGCPTIEFEWSYDGKPLKTYKITFMDANIKKPRSSPALTEVLKKGFDFYYQRAGQNIAGAYSQKNGFIPILHQAMNDGGYFVTDDHGFIAKRRFPLALPEISYPGQASLRKAIKAINSLPFLSFTDDWFDFDNYGWDVDIRQKLPVAKTAVPEILGPDVSGIPGFWLSWAARRLLPIALGLSAASLVFVPLKLLDPARGMGLSILYASLMGLATAFVADRLRRLPVFAEKREGSSGLREGWDTLAAAFAVGFAAGFPVYLPNASLAFYGLAAFSLLWLVFKGRKEEKPAGSGFFRTIAATAALCFTTIVFFVPGVWSLNQKIDYPKTQPQVLDIIEGGPQFGTLNPISADRYDLKRNWVEQFEAARRALEAAPSENLLEKTREFRHVLNWLDERCIDPDTVQRLAAFIESSEPIGTVNSIEVRALLFSGKIRVLTKIAERLAKRPELFQEDADWVRGFLSRLPLHEEKISKPDPDYPAFLPVSETEFFTCYFRDFIQDEFRRLLKEGSGTFLLPEVTKEREAPLITRESFLLDRLLQQRPYWGWDSSVGTVVLESRLHEAERMSKEVIPYQLLPLVEKLRETDTALREQIRQVSRANGLPPEILGSAPFYVERNRQPLEANLNTVAKRNRGNWIGRWSQRAVKIFPAWLGNIALPVQWKDFAGSLVHGKTSMGLYQLRPHHVRKYQLFGPEVDANALSDREIAWRLLDPRVNAEAFARFISGVSQEVDNLRAQAVEVKRLQKSGLPERMREQLNLFHSKFWAFNEEAYFQDPYINSRERVEDLVELFAKLPAKEKMGMESWRLALFHPLYWDKIWRYTSWNGRMAYHVARLDQANPSVGIISGINYPDQVSGLARYLSSRDAHLKSTAMATLNSLSQSENPEIRKAAQKTLGRKEQKSESSSPSLFTPLFLFLTLCVLSIALPTLAGVFNDGFGAPVEMTSLLGMVIPGPWSSNKLARESSEDIAKARPSGIPGVLWKTGVGLYLPALPSPVYFGWAWWDRHFRSNRITYKLPAVTAETVPELRFLDEANPTKYEKTVVILPGMNPECNDFSGIVNGIEGFCNVASFVHYDRDPVKAGRQFRKFLMDERLKGKVVIYLDYSNGNIVMNEALDQAAQNNDKVVAKSEYRAQIGPPFGGSSWGYFVSSQEVLRHAKRLESFPMDPKGKLCVAYDPLGPVQQRFFETSATRLERIPRENTTAFLAIGDFHSPGQGPGKWFPYKYWVPAFLKDHPEALATFQKLYDQRVSECGLVKRFEPKGWIKGLFHFGMLRDQRVIESVVRFIQEIPPSVPSSPPFVKPMDVHTSVFKKWPKAVSKAGLPWFGLFFATLILAAAAMADMGHAPDDALLSQISSWDPQGAGGMEGAHASDMLLGLIPTLPVQKQRDVSARLSKPLFTSL